MVQRYDGGKEELAPCDPGGHERRDGDCSDDFKGAIFNRAKAIKTRYEVGRFSPVIKNKRQNKRQYYRGVTWYGCILWEILGGRISEERKFLPEAPVCQTSNQRQRKQVDDPV